MATNFSWMVVAVTCMALVTVHAQLTQKCLGCICEASSGCDQTLRCSGEVCGALRLTWGYWSDSGKPTVDNSPADAPDAYARCANDIFCAGRSVEGYMNKFGQDCNGDKVIDCKDYARIHRLGGYGCGGGLDPKYENALNQCLLANP